MSAIKIWVPSVIITLVWSCGHSRPSTAAVELEWVSLVDKWPAQADKKVVIVGNETWLHVSGLATPAAHVPALCIGSEAVYESIVLVRETEWTALDELCRLPYIVLGELSVGGVQIVVLEWAPASGH